MIWLRTIAREIFGLFVEDGTFAIAILVWLLLVGGLHAQLPLGSVTVPSGPTLFLGLALILTESALRFARSRRK